MICAYCCPPGLFAGTPSAGSPANRVPSGSHAGAALGGRPRVPRAVYRPMQTLSERSDAWPDDPGCDADPVQHGWRRMQHTWVRRWARGSLRCTLTLIEDAPQEVRRKRRLAAQARRHDRSLHPDGSHRQTAAPPATTPARRGTRSVMEPWAPQPPGPRTSKLYGCALRDVHDRGCAPSHWWEPPIGVPVTGGGRRASCGHAGRHAPCACLHARLQSPLGRVRWGCRRTSQRRMHPRRRAPLVCEGQREEAGGEAGHGGELLLWLKRGNARNAIAGSISCGEHWRGPYAAF